MRIQPDRDVFSPVLGKASPMPGATGFASTLAAAEESNLRPESEDSALRRSEAARAGSRGGAYERLIVANRGKPPTIPLAQRWGEYGPGAQPGGYGDPPDPADFQDVPVGSNVPAHPLNPAGISVTEPPFAVVGYTGRGTPIPPGFYNLAYYEMYLEQGGKPLLGFPAYHPEDGTLQEVYGTFGDGRPRATSFDEVAPEPSPGPCGDRKRPCGCHTQTAPTTSNPPAPATATGAADGAGDADQRVVAARYDPATRDALVAALRALLDDLMQSA